MSEDKHRPLGEIRLNRRTLLKGLAASTGLALLAACGSSDSGSGSGSGGAQTTTTTAAAGTGAGGGARSGGPVTINWFAGRDTSGHTPKQVEAFNAQSNNIKINYQEQGANTDQLREKLVTVLSAKDSAADLVSLDVPFVPEFAAAGWVTTVDDALPQGERGQFFKGTLDGATYDGKLYGVPWYNNGPGLFYRKDLLDAAGIQPPKTYDQLLDAAKRLQTPEVNGFIAQTGQNEGGMITWLEYLWGHGGDIVDDKLNVVVDRGTAGVEALQKLLDFMYKDRILPEATLTMLVGNDATNVFTDGRAAFLRFWLSGTQGFDGEQSKIKGKWGVTTLPSKTGQQAGPGCLGTWNLGISAFSRYPKETAEAIRFLTSQDQQKGRYLGNVSLPTRPAVFDDTDVKAKYNYVDAIRPALDNLKPRPVTPFYGQMSADALRPNFGAAMTRGKAPDQAIRDMAAKLKEIVKG